MAASKEYNRNKWSNVENNALLDIIKSSASLQQAFKEASTKLGRSALAISGHWYGNKYCPGLRLTTPKNTITLVNPTINNQVTTTKVMYHNGVSKELIILKRTDKFIIAQLGDDLITVEL